MQGRKLRDPSLVLFCVCTRSDREQWVYLFADIDDLLCWLLGASLQCTAQHVQVSFNPSWATLCVCGGGLDSSVADPLPVRAVGSVWPRDRLSSAGMVVFYHVRFLVLENLRHFTLFGRFSFLTHPLCFWLSVAGILYDEILCDEIWLWKGRIGRQGITKECVSSLSPLANEKLQADSVSDNDILGKNPGIKICSCILNWPHPPHNNASLLQVNSSREHLTINQKTAVSSLICSHHSTLAPRLTARFGQCPISFEIWYSLGKGH